MTASIKRLARQETGSVAVEFALIVPIFLLLVVMILDVARILWLQSSLDFAVEQAARYAVVNGQASEGQIAQMTQSRFSAIAPGQATITASLSESEVDIQASLTIDNLIPGLLPRNLLTIESRSRLAR